jgi:hypothetical protein
VNLQNAFARYVTRTTGHAPVIGAVATGVVAALPLYLRGYYEICRAKLFDRGFLLAMQKPDTRGSTPAEYAGHHRKLRATLDKDVVLVLPHLASYTRQQLVRLRVPFVVPDRQMFLPTLLVDLREHFPRVVEQAPQRLSAAAQVVLLRHLLGRPAGGLVLRELAAELRYSAMTLSNVRHELEAAKLCRSSQDGRSTRLVFDLPKRDLWARAEPLLRDPVKARHWIRWARPPQGWLRAGMTALADLSMVSDDPVPTYAARDRDYRAEIESGHVTGCPGPDEAQARVECWRYEPRLLADAEAVDRLSLFLSLRRTDDERVAQALRQLTADLPW